MTWMTFVEDDVEDLLLEQFREAGIQELEAPNPPEHSPHNIVESADSPYTPLITGILTGCSVLTITMTSMFMLQHTTPVDVVGIVPDSMYVSWDTSYYHSNVDMGNGVVSDERYYYRIITMLPEEGK